ncbi:MAG: RNA polymerase sigma factor [Caldilineaceae bacterium]
MQPSIMETIFLAERPRLLRLCGRLSGQPDAAEDLVQETFFQAWKHADRLQDWGEAAPWLSGIAQRLSPLVTPPLPRTSPSVLLGTAGTRCPP